MESTLRDALTRKHASEASTRSVVRVRSEARPESARGFIPENAARRPMQPFARFRGDERGIEGLPIRLVIALVVGVASLSVMMQMISGLAGFGVAELDVQPSPEVVDPGARTVTVRVVGPEREPVANATVVATSGSARLDGVATARTNESGLATVDVAPELGPNQEEGTVELSVKPPPGSEYVDRRKNTAVLVVER